MVLTAYNEMAVPVEGWLAGGPVVDPSAHPASGASVSDLAECPVWWTQPTVVTTSNNVQKGCVTHGSK